MKVWSLLSSDDGEDAIVVPDENVDLIDALLEGIYQGFGGNDIARDNPALIEAVENDVHLALWHRYSAQQMRDEDLDGYGTFWGPEGALKQSRWVLSLPYSFFFLGEKCEEAVQYKGEENTPCQCYCHSDSPQLVCSRCSGRYI